MPYISETSNGGVVLRLHIQPKASKSRVVGLYYERLKIAVASPPVDGKANKEVVRFVAGLLGVGKKDVELKAGLQSRKKTLSVASISIADVRQIVTPFL